MIDKLKKTEDSTTNKLDPNENLEHPSTAGSTMDPVPQVNTSKFFASVENGTSNKLNSNDNLKRPSANSSADEPSTKLKKLNSEDSTTNNLGGDLERPSTSISAIETSTKLAKQNDDSSSNEPNLEHPPSTNTSPVVTSSKLKKRMSTGDLGQLYVAGIAAHVAIQLAKNEEVEDFQMYNNLDGFGAFDDIVCKVKYRNERDDELLLLQVKHKERNKGLNILNVFERKTGIFYLPQYQESFRKIHNDKKNNSLELFQNVKLERYKFVLFSNIECSDNNPLKYCDLNGSSVMKAINTKQSSPFKIVNNQLSQNIKISEDFFDKCWIYFNQKNTREIEELILDDLERNISLDNVKKILSNFANWTKQQYNEKLRKSQVINLIIENCLEIYDFGARADSYSTATLDDSQFFQFVCKTKLNNVLDLIADKMKSYTSVDFNFDLWHSEVDVLNNTSEIKDLVESRKVLYGNTTYCDVYHVLCQINKLPMLVLFTNEFTKNILFVLENFLDYLNPKSVIFIYETPDKPFQVNYNEELREEIIKLDKALTFSGKQETSNDKYIRNIPIDALVTILINLKKTGGKKTKNNTKNKPTPKKSERKIKWHKTKELGRGCMGTIVYQGVFEQRKVAVKILPRKNFTNPKHEADILHHADDHANVINYYCTEEDKDNTYIALEECDGNLEEYVEKKKDFGNIAPLDILKGVTSGLAHLHKVGIVHRDIKPNNILLKKYADGVRALVSDFGISKKSDRVNMKNTTGVTGTRGWAAPEMQSGEEIKIKAVDVFSLGCVFYYVLSEGDHPFGKENRREGRIEDGNYNLLNLKGLEWEIALQKPLVESMISHKSEDRPECEDILAHPMFWNKKKILDFFKDVNDYLQEFRSIENTSFKELNAKYKNWMKDVDKKIADDLRKKSKYEESVTDLFRAIRNLKEHWNEKRYEIKEILGEIPDEFTNYWLKKFPSLLFDVWTEMKKVKDKHISKYYVEKK